MESENLFPDQVMYVSEAMFTLKEGGAEELMTDAGVTDSSYPWTDEAYERANAIVRACGL